MKRVYIAVALAMSMLLGSTAFAGSKSFNMQHDASFMTVGWQGQYQRGNQHRRPRHWQKRRAAPRRHVQRYRPAPRRHVQRWRPAPRRHVQRYRPAPRRYIAPRRVYRAPKRVWKPAPRRHFKRQAPRRHYNKWQQKRRMYRKH